MPRWSMNAAKDSLRGLSHQDRLAALAEDGSLLDSLLLPQTNLVSDFSELSKDLRRRANSLRTDAASGDVLGVSRRGRIRDAADSLAEAADAIDTLRMHVVMRDGA